MKQLLYILLLTTTYTLSTSYRIDNRTRDTEKRKFSQSSPFYKVLYLIIALTPLFLTKSNYTPFQNTF